MRRWIWKDAYELSDFLHVQKPGDRTEQCADGMLSALYMETVGKILGKIL